VARTVGLVGALALAAGSACSVLVSTSDLSGAAADTGDGSSSADGPMGTDAAAATGPLPSSCRALHAKAPDAGSGAYDLALADGGVLNAYCDMESFDGGWTRVTPAMVVEEKGVQDYEPQSPAKVEVSRGTDAHGGVFFDVQVTAVNCANNPLAGPGHYFLVGELDNWSQIMASYAFTASSSCWNIFGDQSQKHPLETNVVPFDLSVDLIGPQLNMSRTMAGGAIPFDGRLTACNDSSDNFWNGAYESSPKSARVVLRRLSHDKPAGLGIATDCGLAGWKIADINVR
jgi:hypothetical protein